MKLSKHSAQKSKLFFVSENVVDKKKKNKARTELVHRLASVPRSIGTWSE